MTPPPPPGRRSPLTIRDRYNTSAYFTRVTVIGHRRSTRNGPIFEWCVLGPGLLWLGQPFPTHADAITFAQHHATKRAIPTPQTKAARQ